MFWRRVAVSAVSAVAVVVGAGAGLAACGSSAPSKQAFLAKADPVCQQGSDAAALYTTPSDVPGLKDFAVKVAGTTDKTVAGLDKLKFPSGKNGDDAHAMVKAMTDAAASAKAVGPAVDKGDYPGIEKASKAAADAYKAADDKARALGSAQCGKGDDAAAAKLGQTAGPTLKETFVSKADSLCQAARTQVLAIAQPKTTAEAKTYIARTLPIGIKLHDDIKALPAPDFERPKLEDFFSAWDTVVNVGKQMQDAVNSTNQRQILDLVQQVAEDSATMQSKAAAYGFHQCGQA